MGYSKWKDDMDMWLEAFSVSNGVSTKIGELRNMTSMEVTWIKNDVGSLTFKYPKSAPEAKLLQRDFLELQVVMWVPTYDKSGNTLGTYHRPPNGRFILLSGTDDAVEDNGVMSFTCPSIAYLLDKWKVRKGKHDDALNKKESEAEKAMDNAENEMKSKQSSMNSAASNIKSHLKSKKTCYITPYFVGHVKVRHKKKKAPTGTLCYHTKRKALYKLQSNGHYKRVSTKKKNGKTDTTLTGYMSNALKAYDAYAAAKSTYAAKKAAYHKAHTNAKEATKNGQRPFVRATAGRIMKTVWDQVKHDYDYRLQGFHRGFNGTYASGKNSKGKLYQKWPSRFNTEITVGSSLLDVLKDLSDQGKCDWRMRGKTLDMFKPGTMGRDVKKTVVLRVGRDLMEGPDTWTWDNYAGSLFVKGGANLSFVMGNSGADARSPWGRLEKTVAVTGTKTADAKKQALKEGKDALKRFTVQSTRKLVIVPGSPRPMYDYMPGDRISTFWSGGAISTGFTQSREVKQITLTRNDSGTLEGALILGDIHQSSGVQFLKTLGKVTGGDTTVIAGGAVPQLPQPKRDVPQAVRLPSRTLAATALNKINLATGKSTGITTLSLGDDANLDEAEVEEVESSAVPPLDSDANDDDPDWVVSVDDIDPEY